MLMDVAGVAADGFEGVSRREDSLVEHDGDRRAVPQAGGGAKLAAAERLLENIDAETLEMRQRGDRLHFAPAAVGIGPDGKIVSHGGANGGHAFNVSLHVEADLDLDGAETLASDLLRNAGGVGR